MAPDPVDRILILAVHLLWTGLRGSGKWLLDSVLLARSADAPDPEELVQRADALDQAICVVLLARAARLRWRVSDLAAWEDGLLSALRGPERRLIRRMDHEGPFLDGAACISARRLSRRSTSKSSALLSGVWCHPGLELGIPSDAPLFWLHRMRHAAMRVRRALRGFTPLANP